MRWIALLACGLVVLAATHSWRSRYHRDYEKVTAEFDLLALREFGVHDLERLTDQAIRCRVTLPIGKTAQMWCDQGNVSSVYPEPRMNLQHGAELIIYIVNGKRFSNLYIECFCYRRDHGFPLVVLDRRSIRVQDKRALSLLKSPRLNALPTVDAGEENVRKYAIAKLSSGETVFLYFELK